MEIYAYAELLREDEATSRYKGMVDHWIPTLGLSDETLAERIRADEIDVLIDLAGHTVNNRLQAFARKPAPVSVSWLGYGYTTGLTAIDYLLTDAASVPAGSEGLFSETPWRLTTPAYAFRPATGMGPVGALPAYERSFITFGTLTRAIRINHRTIRVWSEILKRVEGSRLVVNSKNFQDLAMQEALAQRFAAHGIRREQLEIGFNSPPWDVLRRMDIGLDCFPHNSGTTLFETLYMGVPYVTLAGRPSVGRLGSSILEGVGHPEWIARSEEEYIEKAVALAADLPGLAKLRAELRQEMEASPLMDEAGFARRVEVAYREMFAHWVAAQQKQTKTPLTHSVPTIKQANSITLTPKKEILPSPEEESTLVTLFNQGYYNEGVALAQRMTERFPQHGFGWKLLGALLKLQGNSASALVAMQKSAQLLPHDQQAQGNLGVVLAELNQLPEAEAAHRRALAINPQFAEAHCNLGATLKLQGRIAEAEVCLRQAVALRPDYAQAHYNLGVILNDKGNSAEAEAAYIQALACNPAYAEAQLNLGSLFTNQSRLKEAESSYRQALALKPDYEDAYTHLLFALSHDITIDAASLFAEHCHFGEQFEAPLRASWPRHPNTRDPDRCLQVGFVSADLNNHAVAHFIDPVWAQLAHFPSVVLHAYYTHTVEDAATQRLRTYVKHWHSVAALSDADLAQKIMGDGIDILIDLSGHTGKNRLLTFARKPAPVQASWIGYPGTTGLRAMDYYFADRYFLPPGQFDDQFTEKLAYLPASAPFLPAETAPPVNDLPALSAGYLTFGSFNRLGKLTASTITLWSQLLHAVPDARMLLGGMPLEGEYDKLIDSFAQEGITRDRLCFHPRSGMDAYLALHHQVDICLDTSPYAGGTTTLHALWMGVPTLTLAGSTPAGRSGASILGHVGLDTFVAQDAADFVRKGVSWAKDMAALADLRAGLRARCKQSATQHPETIATHFDRALRLMWQRWCKGLPPESFAVTNSADECNVSPAAAPPDSPVPSPVLNEACDKAITYHRAGQLDAAEQLYRAILQAEPKHPAANHHIGLLNVQLQQAEAALPYLLAALETNPEEADYWLAYIDALLLADQVNAAQQVMELGQQHGLEGKSIEALAIRLQQKRQGRTHLTLSAPTPQQYHSTTLNTQKGAHPNPEEEASLLACFEQGRYSEGVALARTMTEVFPQHGFGWKILGALLKLQGFGAEALPSLQKSAQLLPDDPQAQSNLGIVLTELNRLPEAEIAHRRALAINPTLAKTHSNLGATLKLQGRIAEAEACLRQAVALEPDYAQAHYNLGVLLYDQGFLTEAEASYARALAIKPDYAEAESNLGSVFLNQSRLLDAEACFRRALALKPDLEDAFSNLLFLLNYDPDKSGEQIFAVYREYDQHFSQPLRSTWQTLNNSRVTTRRLKIGYASPDFCSHPVRYFLEHLFERHDRQAFEIYAYAELSREDEVTARYKNTVDHWMPTQGLSDEALAERIRADEIDILVDLAGHSAHNRLQVFARKPAPISVSWLGYGYTTGLTAIDYLLTDAASAPAGSEGLFSETPWRLTTPAYAFRPAAGMGPVGALPAHERGFVTFGTLTRAIRINQRTIRVWSEILKRVEGSRLVVNSKNFQEPALQEALAQRFAVHGIRREQLEIGFHSPPWNVLRGIDIGLDCFPHNSGTTLFETLYMGVPYVTLAGRPSVGRLGSSILEGVGHPEWIARSEEEYVEKAVALAADLPALAKLRAGLRQEMGSGPLMDETGFARRVETAYREMFAHWVAGQQAAQPTEITPNPSPPTPTPSQILNEACDKAIAYHRAGQLDAAEQLYRAILQAEPKHPAANHHLGLLNVQLQQAEAALPYLLAALESNPEEADYWLAYIDALLLADQADAAQQVLELGQQHGLEGKSIEALAIRLQQKRQGRTHLTLSAPTPQQYHSTTLNTQKQACPSPEEEASLLACFEQGRYSEGVALARAMTEAFPQHGFGWKALGALLSLPVHSAAALEPMQKAAQLLPQDQQAQSNLGVLLAELNRLPEAEAAHRRALAINPHVAEPYCNLGAVLKLQGRIAEAETSLRQALALNPDYAQAYFNLGVILWDQERLDEAEAAYVQALACAPGYAEAHLNLSVTLLQLGRLNEAESSCRAAIAANKEYPEAYNNLGNVLREQGHPQEAEASYRRALTLKPIYPEAYSNLLFNHSCNANYTATYCREEARQYGLMLNAMVGKHYSSWSCSSQPTHLRVGLVSGDLHNHPVGYFLESLLPHIDLTRIELIAYPTHPHTDELSARIAPYFAAWNLLTDYGDEDAARLIHADGVHILIDASGHTSCNRLPVFAWKPAPIQVSWLGYFATTGVEEVDYVLGDPFVTPEEENDHFTERVWRLPESYLCFTPPNLSLEVTVLPALLSDYVTFGSFNNLSKANDAVITLWARILHAVPRSRLFLKTWHLSDESFCTTTRQRFAALGISAERLILEGRSPRAELLAAYQRVDIALDPFPYPGGTTSVEALWMGVPLITRRGDRFLSHIGESIAHNVGLADWIAADDDDYVTKAISHTNNLEQLASIRTGLRAQVLASPLCNAPRFARNLEAALWGMWQQRKAG